MIFSEQNRTIAPVPCITDRHWRAIKYRWEFLRRNKSYQDDYGRMTERYGPESLIPGPLTFLPDPNLQFQPKPKEYLAVAWKWGFDRHMVDPTFSFEDLCKEARKSYSRSKTDEPRVRARVVQRLGYGLQPWPPLDFSAGGSYIEIVIDLAMPDEFLKDEVMNQVNFIRELRGVKVDTELPKRRWNLYEKYLQVFDLAKSGLTNLEIASKLFPDEWDIAEDDDRKDEKFTDQESLLVKVSRYRTEARRLVNGGYRKIV